MINYGSQKLKAWRMRSNATYDAAAAEIGVARQTWFGWETGRRLPRREYMPGLCALVAGLDAGDFYREPVHVSQLLGLAA